MPSGFHMWSQTASANATADSTINWAEGQAPSSVNDSDRNMMAVQAKWRDDTSGTLLTAGTSTAYTLATNTVFTSLALMSGQRLVFVAHVANGANATLNVDGLGAKVLQTSAGVALPAGIFAAGQIYSATYNNGASAWFVNDLNAPFPSTTLMLFQQTTAPVGWTKQTTHNDKALRVVSGTASSGGATAFTSVFNAAGGSTVLTLAQLPNPQFNFSGFTGSVGTALTGSVSIQGATGNSGANPGVPSSASGGGIGEAVTVTNTMALASGTVTFGGTGVFLGGSSQGHTHVTPDIAYVDLIIASKD